MERTKAAHLEIGRELAERAAVERRDDVLRLVDVDELHVEVDLAAAAACVDLGMHAQLAKNSVRPSGVHVEPRVVEDVLQLLLVLTRDPRDLGCP